MFASRCAQPLLSIVPRKESVIDLAFTLLACHAAARAVAARVPQVCKSAACLCMAEAAQTLTHGVLPQGGHWWHQSLGWLEWVQALEKRAGFAVDAGRGSNGLQAVGAVSSP